MDQLIFMGYPAVCIIQLCMIIVPITNLQHFTHKASVTSIHAEANVHSADLLMSVFVNELASPYARTQQGQCVQQCQTILANTLCIAPIDYCVKYSLVYNTFMKIALFHTEIISA